MSSRLEPRCWRPAIGAKGNLVLAGLPDVGRGVAKVAGSVAPEVKNADQEAGGVAPANDLPVADENAADTRIRVRGISPTRRQLQCFCHVGRIDGRKTRR